MPRREDRIGPEDRMSLSLRDAACLPWGASLLKIYPVKLNRTLEFEVWHQCSMIGVRDKFQE